MKISKVDYENVLIIVEDCLSEVSQVFGISFVIEEVLLYGSQITPKIEPNDIDIFVKVRGIKITNKIQFLASYGPSVDKITSDDLMEIVYVWLHDNQPSYNNIPIDINFRDYDFDMDGNFVVLNN